MRLKIDVFETESMLAGARVQVRNAANRHFTSFARHCPVLVIGTSKSQLELHQRRNHDGEVHYSGRFMAPCFALKNETL